MSQDKKYGYADGLLGNLPDPSHALNRDDYYAGYQKGSEERLHEPLVVAPDWMTQDQAFAISRLYIRDHDGAANRAEFFKRVDNYGDYCGLPWCGMFMGIEKDGYTHS